MNKYNSHSTLSTVISKHTWNGFLQEKVLQIQNWENLNLMFLTSFQLILCLLQHLTFPLHLCLWTAGLLELWSLWLLLMRLWGPSWACLKLSSPLPFPSLAPDCSLSGRPYFCQSFHCSSEAQAWNLSLNPANSFFPLQSSLFPAFFIPPLSCLSHLFSWSLFSLSSASLPLPSTPSKTSSGHSG